MNFFTLDCYNDWYRHGTEDALSTAYERYTRHLEAMRGVLPEDVLSLARLPGVDDGLIIEVQYRLPQKQLRLVLRCGDLQMGYYDLLLTYEDASLTPQDERTLAHVAETTERRQESDLAYHEVDRGSSGGIEHRFLFHPGVWFTIRCDALHWEKVDRPDRKLPHLPNRFSGASAADP